ncbi:MAG: flagellar biosynthesis protein FlhB [Rhodospirillales bacterium]
MAEQDDSSRTEQPTERRLDESRKRGNVAVSQDLKVWASLVVSALLVASWLPGAARQLVRLLTPFLAAPEAMAMGPEEGVLGLGGVLRDVGLLVAPMLAAFVVVGAASCLVQVGLLWAPAKIKPNWEKISPLKGFSRLFSPQALVEFVKGIVKVIVVGAAVIAIAWPVMVAFGEVNGISLVETLAALNGSVGRMLGAAAAVMTVIAIADVLLQRFTRLKQLRMTRNEVRDEAKQTEGDPHVKGRLKRLRMERSRKRAIAAVPEATVVIANPTHFAVALRYDMASMPAPKVVAKGVDFLALRIREIAEKHGVPVVENPPLARSLHAAVDVDDEIPPEHYQAVAQVIGYVMQLDREKGGRPAMRQPGA